MVDCHGWAVQCVERDGTRPPWAYTVGLTQRGRSELVVTGMPLTKAEDLLNAGCAAASRFSAGGCRRSAAS